MEKESFRALWDGQTDGQTQIAISRAPVGAKNVALRNAKVMTNIWTRNV